MQAASSRAMTTATARPRRSRASSSWSCCEKSVRDPISEMVEGEFAESMGMFLDNLEKEAGTPPDSARASRTAMATTTARALARAPKRRSRWRSSWSYYDEWDFRASDYRPRWCRVGERLGEEGDAEYYEETLQKHHGLVSETRRQFELMRPETLPPHQAPRGRRGDRPRPRHRVHRRQARRRRPARRRSTGAATRSSATSPSRSCMDMSASTDEEIEKQKVDYARRRGVQRRPAQLLPVARRSAAPASPSSRRSASSTSRRSRSC